MRFRCFYCNEIVSNEINPDAIIRAILQCPDCIIADDDPETFTMKKSDVNKMIEKLQKLGTPDEVSKLPPAERLGMLLSVLPKQSKANIVAGVVKGSLSGAISKELQDILNAIENQGAAK